MNIFNSCFVALFNDIASMLLANYWLGLAYGYSKCDFSNGEYYLKKSTDICIAANSTWGTSTNKSTLAQIYYYDGNLNSCFQTSEEALNMAEETEDIYSKAIAYTMHGVSFYGKGFLKEAITHLLKGTKLCESINVLVWNGFGHIFLGELYFEVEDYKRSIDHFSRTISIFEHNRLLPSYVNLCKTGVVRVKLNGVYMGIKALSF